MTLSIYSDSTGGTALYQETQSGVAFTGGIFNVLIGSNKTNPLPIFDAGDITGTVRPAPDYFLGIAIDAGAELTPRSKLGASPTAWSSRFADSARTAGTAMNLAPNAGGVVTSVNTLGGAVTLSGAGGTTVSKSGQTITISFSGGGGTGIQGIQNIDGSIAIVGPNGPTATVSITKRWCNDSENCRRCCYKCHRGIWRGNKWRSTDGQWFWRGRVGGTNRFFFAIFTDRFIKFPVVCTNK